MKVKFKNITLVSFTHLKNCVSSDDLKPSMQGVNINLKEKRLEATDAHVLMTYPIEIEAESEYDKDLDSLIVPVRFFNRLKYMIDIPLKSYAHLEYVLEDEKAIIYFGGQLIFQCNYIDAKYPKIENVLPNDTWKRENVDVISFNCDVLNRAIKSIPNNFPNNIKLSLYAKNKAVIIESLNENIPKIIGIVMPVLIENESKSQ